MQCQPSQWRYAVQETHVIRQKVGVVLESVVSSSILVDEILHGGRNRGCYPELCISVFGGAQRRHLTTYVY